MGIYRQISTYIIGVNSVITSFLKLNKKKTLLIILKVFWGRIRNLKQSAWKMIFLAPLELQFGM